MPPTDESRAGAEAAAERPSPEFADFDAIQAGDRAVIRKQFTQADVAAFAALSGDYNPLHLEPGFASRTHLGRPVVHGMLVASYVSTLVGMHLPGAGALWVQQSFRWRHPVYAGDLLEISLQVARKSPGARAIAIWITAVNQHGTVVMDGEGTVSVPGMGAPRSVRPRQSAGAPAPGEAAM